MSAPTPRPTPMNVAVSMVVDAFPAHYFKTEILLLSLRKFTAIPPGNIFVQCVDRVDSEFKDFVRNGGYQFREITPYLDGAYCNKLQQLHGMDTAFQAFEGVFLLDNDMVVLGDLDIPCFDKVMAKVVDGPNPAISVLERIFMAAGCPVPGYVESDFGIGPTLATNCNGGFIFIPSHLVPDISKMWRQWGEWLFERPELFDSPQQRIHVDQIAMGLTLASGHFPFAGLTANFNFPLHRDRVPQSFVAEEPLRVLHFHNEIDRFGLITHKQVGCLSIAAAVKRVNDMIAGSHSSFNFFASLKRAQAFLAVSTLPSDYPVLLSTLEVLRQRPDRCRLLIHGGTSKTGSSSLQRFFDQNRNLMRDYGIVYPVSDDIKEPKHQWLAGCLRKADEHVLSQHLQKVLLELDGDKHTLILSTEGIYNHWWDLNDSSKGLLKVIGSYFDTEVWMWFREPEEFLNSLYRQNLANPKVDGLSCYGVDLAFEDMLEQTWFAGHLDYLGFVLELQALFGISAVRVLAYTGDTIGMCKSLLGLSTLPNYSARENLGVNQPGVDMLRIINQYDLDATSKALCVALVKQISEVLAGVALPFSISAVARQRVQQMSALGQAVLAKEFGLNWPLDRDCL